VNTKEEKAKNNFHGTIWRLISHLRLRPNGKKEHEKIISSVPQKKFPVEINILNPSEQ
jgi:hypothetical protein